MEILFDETFPTNDGKRTSRNIWYGYANISVDGEYGKDIKLGDDFMDTLCQTIKKDLSSGDAATETNWYFYGDAIAQDAIGDSVRSTIMVRERDGEFVTNFNISDHDFALSIDAILSFKKDFERRLAHMLL